MPRVSTVRNRVHLSSAALRRAYTQGFTDGQAEAQVRLSCAYKANKQLWQEVLRLDDDQQYQNRDLVPTRLTADRPLDPPNPKPSVLQ